MKKIIIGIIIGISISGIVGVSAATLYYSNKVSYSNENSSVTDVKTALDELYSLTKSGTNKSAIYYLGTGTSFDIKTLFPDVDYNSFTVDNFIIGTSSVPTTRSSWYGNWSNFPYGTGSFNGLNLEKTYTDGVLSISGTSFVVQNCLSSKTNIFCADASATGTVTPYAYLVIGQIENN